MTQTPKMISFNWDRFLEAVYEVIATCADEPGRLGRSRLHGALYYADMCAYMTEGEPITGADYIKEAFGPGAVQMEAALQHLVQQGRIQVQRVVHHGVPKYVVALAGARAPQSQILSDRDRDQIVFWTRWVCGFDKTDFGDVGFRRPWESVRRLGDPIPYATAFMMLPKPTMRRDVERKAS